MLNELGLSVSLEDMFEQFVGLSMPQCIELITQLLGKPPLEGFVEKLRRRQTEALQAEVAPVPGIEDVLASLTVPYCVASSGSREKIDLMLGVTGLLSHFKGRIFTVAEVERPKPAPDVFLHAARRLGVEPAVCAVVEDTPTGVRAGVSAGSGFSVLPPIRPRIASAKRAQTPYSPK